MVNPGEKGKGAIAEKKRLSDYRFDVAESRYFPMATAMLPETYDLSDKIHWIKDQGTSGSCGGQAFSYYMEMKSLARDGLVYQLSAKDLYSGVKLQPEGSRASDLLNRLANSGIAEEMDISSYDNGNPPTEAFMASIVVRSSEVNNRAMQYWVDKTYLSFDGSDINKVKKAIYVGNGAVTALLGNNACWTTQDGVVQVPAQGITNWAHFLCLVGWDDTKKLVKAVNSWGANAGDKGFYYIPYEYFTNGGLVFGEWTVVELPKDKYTTLMKQIGLLKNLIDLIKKLLKLK